MRAVAGSSSPCRRASSRCIRGAAGGPAQHALYFMCHDIEQTVRELEAKGVEFVSPIEDEGWGRLARFLIPGAGEVGLYEPRHPSPLAAFAPGS